MNPGYLMDGLCMQRLALLGFEFLKEYIAFVQTILNVGRNNFRKFDKSHKRCIRLTHNAQERGVNVNVIKPKKALSKASEWRHCKRINKGFEFHGMCMRIKEKQMKHKWISMEYNTPHNDIFDSNETLSKSKMREFSQLQRQLWRTYHTNPKLITKSMLNTMNRRYSIRDLQENRVVVSKYTKYRKKVWINKNMKLIIE